MAFVQPQAGDRIHLVDVLSYQRGQVMGVDPGIPHARVGQGSGPITQQRAIGNGNQALRHGIRQWLQPRASLQPPAAVRVAASPDLRHGLNLFPKPECRYVSNRELEILDEAIVVARHMDMQVGIVGHATA